MIFLPLSFWQDRSGRFRVLPLWVFSLKWQCVALLRPLREDEIPKLRRELGLGERTEDEALLEEVLR